MREIEVDTKDALMRIAYLVANSYEDKIRTELNTITSQLATGVYVKDIDDNTVAVGNSAPYAAHLEYGTVPHFVKPISKKSLHWKQGGKLRFSKSKKSLYWVGGTSRFSKGHWVSGIKPRYLLERSANEILGG